MYYFKNEARFIVFFLNHPYNLQQSTEVRVIYKLDVNERE